MLVSSFVHMASFRIDCTPRSSEGPGLGSSNVACSRAPSTCFALTIRLWGFAFESWHFRIGAAQLVRRRLRPPKSGLTRNCQPWQHGEGTTLNPSQSERSHHVPHLKGETSIADLRVLDQFLVSRGHPKFRSPKQRNRRNPSHGARARVQHHPGGGRSKGGLTKTEPSYLSRSGSLLLAY